MIYIFSDLNSVELNEIALSAIERSFGIGSSRLLSYQDLIIVTKAKDRQSIKGNKFDIFILLNPSEEISTLVIHALENWSIKIMIFGGLPSSLANFLNVKTFPITERMKLAEVCNPAKPNQYSESSGTINYKKKMRLNFGGQTQFPSRSLCRFDFTNEWNNLGYGAITLDSTIWAISQGAKTLEENVVAELRDGDNFLSAYCGLWDFHQSSLLWFNRPVGPVDSYEWILIEQFISEYRFGDIPSWPVISEIPYGYESAITMRLDCDEDIDSARALGNVYQQKNIPFSLALHAAVLSDPAQHLYPKEVLHSGGAILSHTLTHAPNWGGSEDAAKHEGKESARIINETIGVKPRYAISPFHHTPVYARKGLAESGYRGCVGGIISNDPDYVMARAGRPPHSQHGFIGHTQQCMFHGDCMLEDGDSLAIFKGAYEQAKVSKTFFGYLDHPFSPRYQYGWITEERRIEAHMEFIEYIQRSSSNAVFLNQNDALDFLFRKSVIRICERNGQLQVDSPENEDESKNDQLKIYIQYGPNQYPLNSNGVFL